MADFTKIRVSTSVEIYHSSGASGDKPLYLVGTTDINVQNLGGSGDTTLETGFDVTYTTAHKVVSGAEAAIGTGACIGFLYIKHTGFTTATKETTTKSSLGVSVGGNIVDGGFYLAPGEAICLHKAEGGVLPPGSDNLSEFKLTSSAGGIYTEIVYL